MQVKHDERTGRYRDLTANLKEYINVNEIPPVGCQISFKPQVLLTATDECFSEHH